MYVKRLYNEYLDDEKERSETQGLEGYADQIRL